MEDRFFDHTAIPKVLDHNALEQRGGHPGIPDRIRIHDDDGTASANSQARCLSSLHPIRSEQEAFTLKQVGKQGIQLPAPAIRRTEPARANEDVT